jgi:DNA-binding NtrC family response regulator
MDRRSIKLLLVEDNPGDARLIEESIAESQLANFRLLRAGDLAGAAEQLGREDCDAVLLDLSLPGSQGLDTLLEMQKIAPDAAIVVLTGLNNEAVAVEAVRNGAQDYLVKGRVDGDVITRAVRYALERKLLMRDRERLINELRDALATVKRLSGLLPICSSCKKIRDDQGYWRQVEEYLHDHSEADFTHGICPECMHRLYPDVFGGDEVPGEGEPAESKDSDKREK